MEPVFFITLISFWVYPVLAALLLNFTKKYLKLRRKILSILLLLSVIILLSIAFGISTTSTVLNWLLATSLYFTGLTFLMLIFSMKNMALKIISGMVLFSVLAIGYLSSTLGVLGIGFIIDELTPSRIIILAPNVVYKQYDLGNAISKTDGIKVSLFKVSKWFPGFEYQFFSHTYTEEVYNPNYGIEKNSKDPVLYSYNFNVKYLPKAQQLLLLDSVKTDIINLK